MEESIGRGRPLRLGARALGYRQSQVLRLAKHSKRVLGRTPSYSEIKNTLGIATKGEVARIVKSLEKRGLMRRAGRGRARRIRLP